MRLQYSLLPFGKIMYLLIQMVNNRRIDHIDGTHDSIRYVKGGKIDKRRNK